MTLEQDYIGKTLLRGMVEALEKKGSITIDDIASIFENVAHSVNAGDPRVDMFVRSEITKLAHFISEAKHEILAIIPEDSEEEFFNSAGEELNAVVKSTEDATNTILDATDAIMAAAGNIKDSAAQHTIMEHANTIYDACTFQDITGQRINKVIKTLEYVEAKVAKLAKLFGNDNPELQVLAEKDVDETLKDKRPDAHLMAGPQLPDKGVSQDDIDALFGN